MTLQEIQQKLKVPKSNRNSFGNYNYRNCEDILEAVKPLLGGNILTIKDEVVQIGDRYYVKATVQFVDAENATGVIEVTAFAREAEEKKGMDASQITGAASSYARKYALNGLFLIDDTRDADSDAPQQVKTQSPKITARQTVKNGYETILDTIEKTNSIDLLLQIGEKAEASTLYSPEEKIHIKGKVNAKLDRIDPIA